MIVLKVWYDDSPNDVITRIKPILINQGIQIEQLEGGIGFDEYKICFDKDPVDFMNWTLGGDCQFSCVDEDEWTLPDYMTTRETFTTQQVYEAYLKYKEK